MKLYGTYLKDLCDAAAGPRRRIEPQYPLARWKLSHIPPPSAPPRARDPAHTTAFSALVCKIFMQINEIINDKN